MRIEHIHIPNIFKSVTAMNNGSKRPLALIIIDGWGYSPRKEGNAIALAHTPNYDEICDRYPRTLLAASGVRVGLAPDAPGSSEVGHLSIGAGRIVQTDVSRVQSAVRDGSFFDNPVLSKAISSARERNADVHLVGLLSDGDVHASPENLFALLRMAKRAGIGNAFVHAILDGRDVMPRTADVYCEAIEIKMADIGLGRLATLCGRFYAMDRDHNWERTARAYTMLVHSEGERASDPVSAIRSSFLRGITDEFIQPIVLENEAGEPVAAVRNGDLVIFFNHRGDRMRQLVKALAVSGTDDFQMFAKPQIDVVCLTEYDRSFDLPVAFRHEGEDRTLPQVLADHGITNCRITESDKFAQVTYFFNGGVEMEQPLEKRFVVQSVKGSAIESQPEAGSFKLTDQLLRAMESGEHDVFIVNLASVDLVAHTGNLPKTIEAVQYLDTCLGGIVEKVREVNGIAVITSDHGNSEEMANLLTGEPSGAHTANPVPFHLIDEESNALKLREGGALEDVAPTLLGILGIDKPAEMTGSDLRMV